MIRETSQNWFKSTALFMLFVLFTALNGTSVTATESEERLDALFQALAASENETDARLIENDIWRSWIDLAPSAEIKEQVEAAMARREVYDFAGAKEILDKVVVAAPDYSEGWNQRAFVRFLQQDYDGSLQDIDRALELEPRHFGALSGKALIFLAQGRANLAQMALRAAVKIHPFLKERSLLVPQKNEDGVEL